MFSSLEKVDTQHRFYKDALEYWSSIPPTVDGMLGGYAYISETDVRGSTAFLQAVMRRYNVNAHRALDCGAGIGRVAKNLLIPLFEKVDLLEVNEKFLDKAPDHIGKRSKHVQTLISFVALEYHILS